MRIAFVYDRVNKFGGAERVLLALHEIWPAAPLYTAIYNKEKTSWADGFEIHPSFLNSLPFSTTNHEMLPILTPYAFESFEFNEFDVVLSITSSDAKGIITTGDTLHICYLLTPTRYLWNDYRQHLDKPGFKRLNPIIRKALEIISPGLRHWDYIASRRPDIFLAISNTIARRIKIYYKREAKVLYPPTDIEKFIPAQKQTLNNYFLIVSRLVPYKKIDYAVSAFNRLGWKLKIIGSGIDEERLKKIANANIEFISSGLTDKKLCWYYQNCKGLIFPGEEDFGISAVEAQACGKPVLSINEGGVSEIIIPGVTGEVYDKNDEASFIRSLKNFMQHEYSVSDCRNNALRFSKRNFQKKMKYTVETCWRKSKEGNKFRI